MDPSGSSPREERGCTKVKALLWSVSLITDSSGHLSKTALVGESKKLGIFYEKIQISDT